MHVPFENGTTEHIQGITCHIPPPGYGRNRLTGDVEYIGIYKRSKKQSEQKWERIKLPKDYEERRIAEEAEQERRKKLDEHDDWVDEDLEAIRMEHWKYRLSGFWFYNNGVPTYITGTHWFYLTWCSTNTASGYMDYRDTDRRLFYSLAYADEDPLCGGIIFIGRRQCGKTYMSSAWMLDRISLAKRKHGGIQSKGRDDAQKVFNKLVNYFVDLPHFFKPTYDMSQGLRPKKELRFFKTTIKGRNANKLLSGEELRSYVDFGPSDSHHYDGDESMFAYLLDEFGKPQDEDVENTWNVVRPCMDKEGRWFGKTFACSTIEDMDVTGAAPKNLWEKSDVNDRDGNGRTKTGLYRIFFGAHESTFFDAYGNPDTERGLTYYNNTREALRSDSRGYSSHVRKNPFVIEEAFRVDGDKCWYDAVKLNDRRDLLSWNHDFVERGNFEWEEKYISVRWVPMKNGRYNLCRGFKFDDEAHRNNVTIRTSSYRPNNTYRYVAAVDPYDHRTTQDDNRRSNAAAYVKKKHAPGMEDDPFNEAYICEYCARPATPEMMYDDILKMCFYFGCELLVETQKPGIIAYFTREGFEPFLMRLPGSKDVGVAASTQNTELICQLTETYIYNKIDKVYFIDLINDWLEFTPEKTTKFDRAMAFGYTEIADKYKVGGKQTQKLKDVNQLFTLNTY